ncbi:putative membrane protein, partial [Vibrio cholerae HC-68A1]
PQ